MTLAKTFTKKNPSMQDESSDTESFVNEDFNFHHNDILICATHGKIYAIHKKNGSRLWRADFPSGSYGGVISLFVTDTDKLIVGSRGKTACLKLMTGELVWLNKMPGFGYEQVSLLSTPSRILKPHKVPTTPSYDAAKADDSIVIGGSMGKIMGINIETGETLWTYNCPGGWYKIPAIIVEPPSFEDERPDQLIYAGCGKWVYCLKAATGEVLWSSKISNSRAGINYMTLATPWSSRLAAEAYTAFTQNPIGEIDEQSNS